MHYSARAGHLQAVECLLDLGEISLHSFAESNLTNHTTRGMRALPRLQVQVTGEAHGSRLLCGAICDERHCADDGALAAGANHTIAATPWKDPDFKFLKGMPGAC